MIYLLLGVVGVGVAALLPRLRHHDDTTPEARWEHFLVSAGLRPVPPTMSDVIAVADRADVPPDLLERAALGRDDDDTLVLVAALTNGRVLVAARRDGPVPSRPGLVVSRGWQLQLLEGPVEAAWATTALRRSPSLG